MVFALSHVSISFLLSISELFLSFSFESPQKRHTAMKSPCQNSIHPPSLSLLSISLGYVGFYHLCQEKYSIGEPFSSSTFFPFSLFLLRKKNLHFIIIYPYIEEERLVTDTWRFITYCNKSTGERGLGIRNTSVPFPRYGHRPASLSLLFLFLSLLLSESI